jgi:ComEC/Rec2-related protein
MCPTGTHELKRSTARRETDSGLRGWLKGFCGRHPMFAAAVVAAACVAAADLHPGWGLLAGAGFGVAGVFSGGWRRGLAWLLCGWISAGVFTWRDGSRRTAEREWSAAPGGWVRAKVLKDAQGGGHFWSAPARLLDGEQAGVKVWWEGRGEMPVAGAVVAARGSFGPLPEARNPGEFDRAAWLRRQGMAAVFQAGRVEGRVETGRWALRGAKIRHGFRDAVTAGLEDDSQEANVIRAVVIGEQPPDAEALIAAFRNSGTLHVFSVSGLHVAMVGSIGWVFLSALGVPRKWAVPALLPLIFGYSWITGNSAPAVRSAWMAAVFLGAFVFRRRPDLLNALGAVLLAAMLWDGGLLFQPGVQLSYGVVAAIAVGAAWASRLFRWMAVPELYLPTQLTSRWQKSWLGIRRNIAQSLGVSVAAGVGSAPLTAYHFGLVTPISVLAGLVLVPLVFVLLVASLVSVAVFPLAPPVSRLVNRLNGHVANGCVLAAEGFAAIPGGHFQVWREKRPTLLVYDLPHGAGAACFSGGEGAAVLMDCGDPQGFKRRVLPSLRRLGIEPDSVVLSHPDGGHLGGGAAVWQALPIRQALMPVELSRSPTYRAWLEKGPEAGIQTRQVTPLASIAFPDGASLETLHAPDPLAVNLIADDRVAVFRLHWRGWKLLFTSDAGMGTERKLLDAGTDLSADVIIAGRHRGDLSLSDPFLDAVGPQAIIASNAPFPIEERLAPDTVDYWKSRGIQAIDQGQAGGVTVRVDDAGNLRIEGFLSASPVVLKRR